MWKTTTTKEEQVHWCDTVESVWSIRQFSLVGSESNELTHPSHSVRENNQTTTREVFFAPEELNFWRSFLWHHTISNLLIWGPSMMPLYVYQPVNPHLSCSANLIFWVFPKRLFVTELMRLYQKRNQFGLETLLL